MWSRIKVVFLTKSSSSSSVILLILIFTSLPVTSSLVPQLSHHVKPTQFSKSIDPSTSLSYSISSSDSSSSVSFSEVHSSPPSSPEILKQKVPTTTSSSATKCEIARTRCAYRMGCGMALQGYMINCADLISNRTDVCSVNCQTALIALMSTDEGEALIDCDCDGSFFCQMNKDRIEVCRSEVMKARAPDSIVSCQTARAICMADLPCSTALTYYYNRCRSLFHPGSRKRCTKLCKNSLDILVRQEKASKMKTCYCEGSEDFNCQTIKESTEQLCLNPEEPSNSIPIFPSSSSSSLHSWPSLLQTSPGMQIKNVSTSITTMLLLLLLPSFLLR